MPVCAAAVDAAREDAPAVTVSYDKPREIGSGLSGMGRSGPATWIVKRVNVSNGLKGAITYTMHLVGRLLWMPRPQTTSSLLSIATKAPQKLAEVVRELLADRPRVQCREEC